MVAGKCRQEKGQGHVEGLCRIRAARHGFARPPPDHDTYAPETGFDGDFPAGGDGKREWLLHCYGMVGAGRDTAPDSGSGVELYAVTGQAPRHLDRNIALVGRVVQGMELLSSLPRGGGAQGAYMGFYQSPSEYTKIRGIHLASELPADQRLPLQFLKTGTASFKAYVE